MSEAVSSRPWRPGSIRQAPLGSFLYLVASITLSALALYVVHSADGKPVETWPIAPSVYLSILATISNTLLRSAFQAGAETYWWSLLLSKTAGVKLRTLQDTWELGHDTSSRFTMTTSFAPVIRSAGIFVLFLAANGPLLQRAVTVDLITAETSSERNLDIRREPMWNLTTRALSSAGWIWSPSAYQDEFAEVVADLNQRRPIRLESARCPADSTCSTTVTVAGFSSTCGKLEHVSDDEITLLPGYSPVVVGTSVLQCPDVGRETTDGCERLVLDYQLGVRLVQHDKRGADELPWLGPDLQPSALQYTSYLREDAHEARLAHRQCTFTSAFIEIPIEITQGNEVRMKELRGDQLARRNKGVESIPSPAVASPNDAVYRTYWLQGIEQTTADLYAGYIIFDTAYDSPKIQGMGPRQFINQSSITARTDTGSNKGHSYSFDDPLEAFSDTLHELSLRYALKRITSTPERTDELDNYFAGFTDRTERSQQAQERMKTKASPEQQVSVQITKPVSVYEAHLLFAAISVGISLMTTLLITLLFTGWRRLGRRFTSSPLEIAKAFDAPLLRQAASNVSGGGIASDLGGVTVRYGESDELQGRGDARLLDAQPEADAGSRDQSEKQGGDTSVGEGSTRPDEEPTVEAGGTKLVIDVAEKVSGPIKGKRYT